MLIVRNALVASTAMTAGTARTVMVALSVAESLGVLGYMEFIINKHCIDCSNITGYIGLRGVHN